MAIRQGRPHRPPLATKSYVTMKSADYILVAGFERPDISRQLRPAPRGHISRRNRRGNDPAAA
jgi:hypothetical protein